MFSPVRRVAYHVENTRVGQQTDLDRLILRVWTDGSAGPQEALDKAVEILRDELSVFGNVETMPALENSYAAAAPAAVYDPATATLPASVYDSPRQPDLGSLSINPQPFPTDQDTPRVTLEGLGLTTRVLHSSRKKASTRWTLCALSDRDLKKVPGIGERSLDEIKQQLAQFGLALRDWRSWRPELPTLPVPYLPRPPLSPAPPRRSKENHHASR